MQLIVMPAHLTAYEHNRAPAFATEPCSPSGLQSHDKDKRPVKRQEIRSSKAPIGATPKHETTKNAITNTRTDVSETCQAVRPAGKRLTKNDPAEVVVMDC